MRSDASVEYYDRDAAIYGDRYSRAEFEDIHRNILAFLPTTGGRVLDVGAGSGRDAVALAERGYEVTAVEPSVALQDWSRHHYKTSSIEWIEDSLPVLKKLRDAGRKYDFILCSAVLMHIPPADLPRSFEVLASLLLPGGHLAVSVREKRPDDPTDIFFDLTDTSLIDAAQRSRLQLVQARVNCDHLGRPLVEWRSFVFQAASDPDASPICGSV